MYLRAAHVEPSIPVLRELIRANPLGIFTTAIPCADHPLLQSSHVPFVLDVADESSTTELGVLRAHLARANPQAQALISAASATKDTTTIASSSSSSSGGGGAGNGAEIPHEVLVMFTSPVQHYVTPRFYTATKPATGKVVPTWNYAAAQVYGRARVYFDAAAPETVDFLSRQLDCLSREAETRIMHHTGVAEGRPEAWAVADAPDRYIELMRKNIIGVEIHIDRLEGKFKMSQEMGDADRQGVIQGFTGLDSEVGSDMAHLVEKRGLLKDMGKLKA